MRIKFVSKVTIPGGPLYRPGDVAETGFGFTPEAAKECIARGWAVLDQPQRDVNTPLTKALDAPPVDKQMTRE